jgi:hypothetical protein
MTSAIIVAAGRGTRMGPNTDKLFLEVSGAPVVAHAWERMDEVESIDEIVLVIRDGMKGDFQELAKTLELQKPYRFVTGGKERQDSVWNGLQSISASASIVAIQDGARPCTPVEPAPPWPHSASPTPSSSPMTASSSPVISIARGYGPCKRRRRFALKSSVKRWARRAKRGCWLLTTRLHANSSANRCGWSRA